MASVGDSKLSTLGGKVSVHWLPVLSSPAAVLVPLDSPIDFSLFGHNLHFSESRGLVAAFCQLDGSILLVPCVYVFARLSPEVKTSSRSSGKHNSRPENRWVQVAKLFSPSQQVDDSFGRSLRLHRNNVALVGSPGDEMNGVFAGAVHVYRRHATPDGEQWLWSQSLEAPESQGYSAFGRSLAILEHTVLVGADLADGRTTMTGAVFWFPEFLTPMDNVSIGPDVNDDDLLLLDIGSADNDSGASGLKNLFKRLGGGLAVASAVPVLVIMSFFLMRTSPSADKTVKVTDPAQSIAPDANDDSVEMAIRHPNGRRFGIATALSVTSGDFTLTVDDDDEDEKGSGCSGLSDESEFGLRGGVVGSDVILKDLSPKVEDELLKNKMKVQNSLSAASLTAQGVLAAVWGSQKHSRVPASDHDDVEVELSHIYPSRALQQGVDDGAQPVLSSTASSSTSGSLSSNIRGLVQAGLVSIGRLPVTTHFESSDDVRGDSKQNGNGNSVSHSRSRSLGGGLRERDGGESHGTTVFAPIHARSQSLLLPDVENTVRV